MDAEKLMMQRRIDNLIEQLETVKRERDGLMHDLKFVSKCKACKHCNLAIDQHPCNKCEVCDNGWVVYFEWRGLCAENGGLPDE